MTNSVQFLVVSAFYVKDVHCTTLQHQRQLRKKILIYKVHDSYKLAESHSRLVLDGEIKHLNCGLHVMYSAMSSHPQLKASD